MHLKLQNFFKTIFFRGNYGYLPTVIFYWLNLLIIILDIINKIINKFSILFFYQQNSTQWYDSAFGNYLDFSFHLFSAFFPPLSKMLINSGVAKCSGEILCLYSLSLFGKMVILGALLFLVFLANFIGVILYNLLVRIFIKKRPTK